jgi:hypothetical protein
LKHFFLTANKQLTNFSYRQKAKEMAKILSSKPISAEDLFIKNVEFATKFDLHTNLDMLGRNLSTVEYYNIDIWASAFVIIFIVLYLFYRLIKLIVLRAVRRCQEPKMIYKPVRKLS